MQQLPPEIIEQILTDDVLTVRDIVNFTEADERYNYLLTDTAAIWKKYLERYPQNSDDVEIALQYKLSSVIDHYIGVDASYISIALRYAIKLRDVHLIYDLLERNARIGWDIIEDRRDLAIELCSIGQIYLAKSITTDCMYSRGEFLVGLYQYGYQDLIYGFFCVIDCDDDVDTILTAAISRLGKMENRSIELLEAFLRCLFKNENLEEMRRHYNLIVERLKYWNICDPSKVVTQIYHNLRIVR